MCKNYSYSVDIWSTGVILAELINKQTFLPGQTYLQQIELILKLLGNPSPEYVNNIESRRAQDYLLKLKKINPIGIHNVIKTQNSMILDLLEKMLQFEPSKRITAEQALEHPFFDSIKDKDFETVYQGPKIQIHDGEGDYKQSLYKEIFNFDPINKTLYLVNNIMPDKKDDELMTLDVDGSLIQIDQKKCQEKFKEIFSNQENH